MNGSGAIMKMIANNHQVISHFFSSKKHTTTYQQSVLEFDLFIPLRQSLYLALKHRFICFCHIVNDQCCWITATDVEMLLKILRRIYRYYS